MTAFDELDLDFAVITESWLRDGPQLRKSIEDLREGRDIDMLTMNRRTRSNKTAGGGIAILFNKNKLTFKEYKIRRGKSEIICATARIVNTSRRLVVIGAYLKPGLRAALRAESMLCIKEAIARCKQEMGDPYVIVTGDFNRFKAEEAIDDYPDIYLHTTPPTRGQATLDIVASNFDKTATTLTTRSPLSTEDGKLSDHSVLHICTNFTNSDRFTKSTTFSRKRTERADKLMGA